jgi:peptidoglycan/LPS O-acetylase OafA/YrhL
MTPAYWAIWAASLALLTIYFIRELSSARSTFAKSLPAIAITVLISLPFLMINVFSNYETKGPIEPTRWPFVAITYLSMTIGMIAQYFFYNEDSLFTFRSMIKPVLASPIVFIPLIASYTDQPHDLANFRLSDFMIILISFQNGFFWKLIFDLQSSKMTSSK